MTTSVPLRKPAILTQQMLHLKRLILLFAILLVTACGDGMSTGGPISFPTPGRGDLVVLTTLPIETADNEPLGVAGLEKDLVETFARELGVEVSWRTVAPEKLADELARSRYHLAAAWLSADGSNAMQQSPAILSSRDVLVQHESSLPLTKLEQLKDKTVHVMAGSRQARTMRQLAESLPGLEIVEVGKGDIFDLAASLGERRIEYAAIDDRMDELAAQFVPALRTTLTLSKEQAIVWPLGQHPNPEMQARVNTFVERIRRDGTLARLEERYFGHIRRLEQPDIEKFLAAVESVLPKLRRHFTAAQAITGLDWRLLAALAYHESHWDPNATSYTNVRGIMMLTEDTADHLGVSNRLDPAESILAGARYLNQLKDALTDSVAEPDRTWLALAAYNLGLGHLNAARSIARQQKANANTWYDMRRVLPLLAKPEYYSKLKSGRGRGGEAVILVENIRSYYDILSRHEPAYTATTTTTTTKAKEKRSQPGIRPGRAPGLIFQAG